MPQPVVLSPESGHYRSLIEIWVSLGASTAETVSPRKKVDSGLAHRWPFP